MSGGGPGGLQYNYITSMTDQIQVHTKKEQPGEWTYIHKTVVTRECTVQLPTLRAYASYKTVLSFPFRGVSHISLTSSFFLVFALCACLPLLPLHKSQKFSVPRVLLSCRDHDVHPYPHGFWGRCHHTKQTLKGLQTKCQFGVWALKRAA